MSGYDPFTGQPTKQARSSILEIINEGNPSDTTVSAVFATLASSGQIAFAGLETMFTLNMSMFLSAGTNTTVELAVSIDGGADIVIGSFFVTQTDNHYPVGLSILTPVVAGEFQIDLRWRRVSGTGTVAVDANDLIQLNALQL